MQEQAIDGKVLDALRDLAGTLGQTAETLWPMAVQATWAKGVCSMIVGLIIVSLAVTLMAFAIRSAVKGGDFDDPMPFLIAGVITLVVGGFGLGVALIDGLSRVLAPEGFTLMKLLS